MGLRRRVKRFFSIVKEDQTQAHDWLDGWTSGVMAARMNDVKKAPKGNSAYAKGYREGAREFWLNERGL